MGDFPYLEWLCRAYTEKAEESDHWVDYLKAHGLANACNVRDPRDGRLKRVYDIEVSWYKGNHPLDFAEHQVLSDSHKQLLREYREHTKKNFDSLRPLQEALDIEDMFSIENVKNAQKFSDCVFSASLKCSEEFVTFTKQIIESTVAIHCQVKGDIPCGFAVIGLGSVARGEATPYSDLEYAFLIEDDYHIEYFKALAIDTYFRIGNIGETPLKYFDINELKCKRDDSGPAFTRTITGFRIDGIMPKAGNIPTGNMHGKPNLIFTVDGLMELYKTTLLTPRDDKADFSDFSDFISSSVTIFSNDEGRKLHETFLKARMSYEKQEVRKSEFVRKKRKSRISEDIETYCFLPEVSPFDPPQNCGIVVKEDIFRYPTLLAMYLKTSQMLDIDCPWETYAELTKLNEECKYFNIVLAISIYIRTTAYLAQGTQSELLSVYSSTSGRTSDRYHVPGNLFVTLCYLLSPIKSLIQGNLRGNAEEIEFADCLATGLQISKTNVMLKAEVMYFVYNSHLALKYLYKAVGKEVVNDCGKFLLFIRDKYAMKEGDTGDRKYLSICCALLSVSPHPDRALSYIEHLRSSERCELRKLHWELLIVECLNKSFQYRKSLAVLDGLELELHDMLRINDFQISFAELGRGKLTIEADISSVSCDLLTTAAKLCGKRGETFQHMQMFDKSVEEFQLAQKLWHHLLARKGLGGAKQLLVKYSLASLSKQLAYVYESQADYVKCHENLNSLLDIQKDIYGKDINHSEVAASYVDMANVMQGETGRSAHLLAYQSLEMYRSVYGDSDHPDIASSYDSIGNMYYAKGRFSEGMDYYTRSLSMRKAVYGEDADHPFIADSYSNIGSVHNSMGRYAAAVECHTKSLNMMRTVYGEDTDHPHIANSYGNIGIVSNAMGEHAAALAQHTRSLDMMNVIYGEDSNHPDVSFCYTNIGDVYNAIGEFMAALKYHTKSLDMRKAIYDEERYHPGIAICCNNIGHVYHAMGEYTAALEYHSKSLAVRKAVYGDDANHPGIAISYNNIGNVHHAKGEYTTALEYHNKSLDMRKVVYGSETNHLGIAISYNNIGNAHYAMREYKTALEYHNKSLAMEKAVYGAETNHPNIAISYSNIGDVYYTMGEHASALEFHNKSLAMKKIVYGQDANHPTMAVSYNNIGNVYYEEVEYAAALEYYMKSLAIKQIIYGEDADHHTIAISYNNIGNAYCEMEEYTDALEYHTKALAMEKAVYGKDADHPCIAAIYNNLANVYNEMDEPATALEYHNKSIAMMKAVYGEDADKRNIAISYSNIGDVHNKMGEHSTMLDAYRDLLAFEEAMQNVDAEIPMMGFGLTNMDDVDYVMCEYTASFIKDAKSSSESAYVYEEDSVRRAKSRHLY